MIDNVDNIYLYNVVKTTTVLGYGKRFAFWVQGCKKRCKNCISPDTHSLNSGGYEVSVESLVDIVLSVKDITGVTISGGEPFLQSSKIVKFINLLNSKRKDMNYIIYSGYKYKELLEKKDCRELLNSIDLLIDGEYIHSLNNNTPLIGSSNQGVFILSDKGEILAEDMLKVRARELEIVTTNTNEVFIVGIPPKEKLNDIMKL